MYKTFLKARVAALVLLALGAGLPGAANAQDKSMTLSLLLDLSTHALHAPYYLAQQKGWFKEAGLAVNMQDGKGSVNVITLVGGGQFDIGVASVGPMAIAASKGVPVKDVSSILRINQIGVLFNKGAGYKKPQDFKGKELIYTAGSQEAPLIDGFFADAGMKRSDVKLLSVDMTAKVSTFLSGKGDALIAPVPYMLPVAAGRRDVDFLRFNDFGMPMLDWGIVASDDTIKNKPAALKAFNQVVARAFAYILDNHYDEAVDDIIKQRPDAKLSRAVTLAMLKAYIPYLYSANTKGKPIGYISAQDWVDTVNTLKKAKLLPPDAKPTDFYTTAFMPK